MEAIQQGRSLKHASKLLKNDKEVILKAVKDFGRALHGLYNYYKMIRKLFWKLFNKMEWPFNSLQ